MKKRNILTIEDFGSGYSLECSVKNLNDARAVLIQCQTAIDNVKEELSKHISEDVDIDKFVEVLIE